MSKDKFAKDALGTRMKESYENRTRVSLPRRTYTILRVDGRAFHTWTRGLTKPYDTDFMSCMDAAASTLCKEIAGARFAFVQSDEISILATDFEDDSSQAWFDGNIQKWVSIASGIATMAFNMKVMALKGSYSENTIPITNKLPNAVFDARVFTIPDYIELENYFIWRQKDAERNSVTLLASNYASHKKLHGKGISQRHEIIHEAGDNWANHPVRFKHGGVIRRVSSLDLETTPIIHSYVPKKGKTQLTPTLIEHRLRTSWQLDESTPVFTKDKNYLRNLIPRHWEGDAAAQKV